MLPSRRRDGAPIKCWTFSWACLSLVFLSSEMDPRFWTSGRPLRPAGPSWAAAPLEEDAERPLWSGWEEEDEEGGREESAV